MNFKDIDLWRKGHMAIAEWVDAWRLIPRAIVAGYAYMTWAVIKWYMNIQPSMMEGCNVEQLAEACIIQGPSTQHAALVTAVIGIAAVVIGLYTNSGKKWSEGFKSWKTPTDTKED